MSVLRVGVVGSVNLDVVARTRRLPQPGETLTDAVLEHHPGGKGGNQALAARRLGAEVALFAKVGADLFAGAALELLAAGGVDLTGVGRSPTEPTGMALIVVAADGENQIVVAPGANRSLAAGDLSVAGFDAVICQLEIPIQTVAAAAESCPGLFCLNAAPARVLPEGLIARADVIVVNAVERAFYGVALDACRGIVVVTLGARGAVALRGGREVARATPPAVEAVDAVGAGDAFVAGLTVALTGGETLQAALHDACAAGALATTRHGAQPSLPWLEEVRALRER